MLALLCCDKYLSKTAFGKGDLSKLTASVGSQLAFLWAGVRRNITAESTGRHGSSPHGDRRRRGGKKEKSVEMAQP